MKWSLQATIAAQNANKMANWVLSVFSDRSKDVLLTLYKSIVRSRLEYSWPVWNPSSMQDIKKLESTQRAFTRYINGCQGLSYWDRLKNLGLMSLQRRRERYAILHLWKIWQGAVPNDLDIQFYDHTRLGTPAIKRNSTTLSRSIYDHSFTVRGPKLWNFILKNIKCAPSFEVSSPNWHPTSWASFLIFPRYQGTLHPTLTQYWTGTQAAYNRWPSWVFNRSWQKVQKVGIFEGNTQKYSCPPPPPPPYIYQIYIY